MQSLRQQLIDNIAKRDLQEAQSAQAYRERAERAESRAIDLLSSVGINQDDFEIELSTSYAHSGEGAPLVVNAKINPRGFTRAHLRYGESAYEAVPECHIMETGISFCDTWGDLCKTDIVVGSLVDFITDPGKWKVIQPELADDVNQEPIETPAPTIEQELTNVLSRFIASCMPT